MYKAKRRRAFVELLEQIERSYLQKQNGANFYESKVDLEFQDSLDTDDDGHDNESDSANEADHLHESEVFLDTFQGSDSDSANESDHSDESEIFLDSSRHEKSESSPGSDHSDESEIFFDASSDSKVDIYAEIGFSPTHDLKNHFSFDLKSILG